MAVQTLGNVHVIVTGFIMVSLSLIVGMYVLDQLTDSAFPPVLTNYTLTTGLTNNTWEELPYRLDSLVAIDNGTNTLDSDYNYTVSETDHVTSVRLYLVDATGLGYNVTYNAVRDPSATITDDASLGIGTLVEWLPIVGLVLAAAFVLTVLVAVFSQRRGL